MKELEDFLKTLNKDTLIEIVLQLSADADRLRKVIEVWENTVKGVSSQLKHETNKCL